MEVGTDKTGNHIGPDLSQLRYHWEFTPTVKKYDEFEFRLYNPKKEISIEVRLDKTKETGYAVELTEGELIEGGDESYPLFDLQWENKWFKDLVSALVKSIRWSEQNK